MAEKVYKTENGMRFPAEAYAYVPDPESPSTWKLRLWETPEKKETARQVGLAVAALGPGGFRGNRVEIPREDLPKVKAKVRAAWKKVNPDKDEDEMPPVLRESLAVGNGDVRLLEYVSGNHALRVDREKGIIFGVKVLGCESANGRTYLVDALRRAVSLYEGKSVNVDHVIGNAVRSYRDRIGKLVNVRVADDGLYGDLMVNPRHALAEQLFWDAEFAPENVGLSHDARGKTVVRNGKVIVESIDQVRSVDIVADPATTRSLYESAVDTVMADNGTVVADADDAVDQAASDEPAASEPVDDEPVDDPDTLPDDAFAIVLPGGVKVRDRTYPLHKRYFPINTPAAVKRSLVAIATNRKLSAEHRAAAMDRAKKAALSFGLNPDNILASVTEGTMSDLASLTLAELKEARPDLVEAIRSSGEIEKELLALKEERDRLAAELEKIKSREAALRDLAEAKLSLDDVPESLRETVLSADSETRKKMIDDLRVLVEAKRNQVNVRASSPFAMTGKRSGDIESVVSSWRA